MGFGGHVFSMITSLRNNARSKRNSWDKMSDRLNKLRSNRITPIVSKSISEEKLKDIKANIRSELFKRNKRLLIVSTIISILGLGIVFGIIYKTKQNADKATAI